jgi:hypothetical protein
VAQARDAQPHGRGDQVQASSPGGRSRSSRIASDTAGCSVA